MGSSSAVTVGLLHAFYAHRGVHRPAAALAREACEIEIETLGKPIGHQDQYASAFGGFNLIEFVPGGHVRVEPIVAPAETFARLHRSLLLFHTDTRRGGDDVLARQTNGVRNGVNVDALVAMRQLAYRMRDALVAGDVDGVGAVLHENWQLNRGVADGVTNAEIDELVERARDAGATGCKILGAGGGGFLLVFAPDWAQPSVRASLAHLREVPFRFASTGSQILLFEQ
jgi:D-glycero-alpha-D-manno-heptose-7-phosphate kinase